MNQSTTQIHLIVSSAIALEAVLSLLAIRAGPGYIGLVFSGGGEIRLEAGEISCRMDDLDHRWPTRWRPDHERG